MPRRTLAIAAATAALAACGGSAQERWAGPPAPNASGEIAVDAFNQHLDEADPQLTESPLAAAIEFLRLDREGARRTSIVVRRGREGQGDAVVSATREGVADDSVRSVRYTLRLRREEEKGWRLRSARFAQRCWPNRGHEEFSAELCV